jgi:hypothetical protein
MKGMNQGIAVILIIIAVIALVVSYLKLKDQFGTTINYDNFAKCLTEKNVVMYGSETCPHCQNQKKMFGDSFQYINYVECSENPSACTEKGVQYIPTWSVNGSLQSSGEKTLNELSSLTGCKIS